MTADKDNQETQDQFLVEYEGTPSSVVPQIPLYPYDYEYRHEAPPRPPGWSDFWEKQEDILFGIFSRINAPQAPKISPEIENTPREWVIIEEAREFTVDDWQAVIDRMKAKRSKRQR